MIIATGLDVKLSVCDIETYHELFDAGFYNPDTGEWTEFEISQWKNELYEFVKFYTSKEYEYLVTYNGIGFDQQVLEYIVDNHQRWADYTNLQIVTKISLFASGIIENQNYNIRPRYPDTSFSIKPIDPFRIHHFDNDAKRTSLKWVEFMMNLDVEEMPVPFDKEGLTQEDIAEVKCYRRNDVMATLGLLYLTIGRLDKLKDLIKTLTGMETDLEELADYAGKNKIEDRINLEKETGLPCLNCSDVKIGEEWNRLDYIKAEGLQKKDLYQLNPIKVKYPFGQKFKKFFPKTMQFQTKQLQDFIENLGETYVTNDKQEFPIVIGGTKYTVAKGGIHSTESNRRIITAPGMKLKDADVGAQYPNSILKLEVYAPHLKRTIIVNFDGKVKLKDHYKQLGKKAEDEAEVSKLKGLETMTKLCLNGGYFGKLGQPGSFLQYPEGLLKVTMGNQIEILMLIEMLEMKGFSVVSGNTDGIVTYFPEDREEEYMKICAEWEEKVGNVKMGKLEYEDFAGLWQESINSYIGKKLNGKVKKKGRFMTEFELHKNKSKRVVALALEAYYIKGIHPIDFIPNHKNIFDFCIAKKAFGDLHYEELLPQGKVKVHKKLIRYYVSNSGNVFMKRGINNQGDPMNNYCEAPNKDFEWLGEPKLQYFNRAFKEEDYDIDYTYYILQTLERIDKIEKSNQALKYAERFKPTIQTSLF